MNLKALILVARELLPLIRLVLREIEEAIPDAGKGAEKLKAALALIESAFAAASGIGVEWAEVKPYVERWIAVIVGLWNATGVFKKA